MKIKTLVKTRRVVLVKRPSLKVAQVQDDYRRALARLASQAVVRVA